MMNKYPVNLSIDYSETSDKSTAFIRLILVIPVLIVLGMLSSIGALLFPVLLLILFKQKYPKWWFDWNVALTNFSLRVIAYGLLMRDEYPSSDEDQAVHVDIPYPDVEKDLDKWKPLYKWFLAIPHIIILCFLEIGVVLCSVFVWFAILFTGRYPKGVFDFVEGVLRWSLRVTAYAILLTTDEYPPFRLGEQ
jgi:hypothetical protein